MTLVPSSSHGGSGSGTVTSVAATDASIVVAGTATDPTIATGTLDAIAAQHPPATVWSNNSKRLTGLAASSAASDAARYDATLKGLAAAAGAMEYATGANAVASLPIGATDGMVLTRASGLPAWSLPVGYQFDYVEVTSGTPTISNNTAATAVAFITGNSVTYDGSTRIKVEFFNYDVNNQCVIDLWDETAVADLGRVIVDGGLATGEFIYGARFLTPAAGARVYSFRGWRAGASNVSFDVGAGGANTVMPMWMRITKA